MVQLCLAGYVALLSIAAASDARTRRVPNWLTGGLVALYPAFVLTSPAPIAWAAAVATAAAVLLLGILVFATRALGGGDVKLITAVSLWAGPDHLALFAAVTSLTGGALALGALILRTWGPLVAANVTAAGAGFSGPPHGTGAPASTGAGREVESADGKFHALPYGIAIAAGGLAVASAIMTR